jgi:hypothetical protein
MFLVPPNSCLENAFVRVGNQVIKVHFKNLYDCFLKALDIAISVIEFRLKVARST